MTVLPFAACPGITEVCLSHHKQEADKVRRSRHRNPQPEALHASLYIGNSQLYALTGAERVSLMNILKHEVNTDQTL
jgi:hypothetical protein